MRNDDLAGYHATAKLRTDSERRVSGADTVASHDDWTVSAQWESIDGRPEPVVLQLNRSGSPITASGVRQLPLGRMLDSSRWMIRFEANGRGEDETFGVEMGMVGVDAVTDYGDFIDRGPQRGRALTSDDLADVARVFLATPPSESGPGAVALACHVSLSAANKRIAAARAAGLIPPSGRK